MTIEAQTRYATLEDAPALADLAGQLGYPSVAEHVAERVATTVAAPDHAVWVVCLADGAVVGWAHAFVAVRIMTPPFAELGGLVVAREHRGRGLGKRLLAAAETWAAAQGVTTLRVRSRTVRTGAHRFYERLGFVPTKQQHVFDKDLVPHCERNPDADLT